MKRDVHISREYFYRSYFKGNNKKIWKKIIGEKQSFENVRKRRLSREPERERERKGLGLFHFEEQLFALLGVEYEGEFSELK